MNVFRMHVQYSTYVDVDADNLDDPKFDIISDYIANSETAINVMLVPLGFANCDSAIWTEPVEAYLPVEITTTQADKLLDWMNTSVYTEDDEPWAYGDLEQQGYKVIGALPDPQTLWPDDDYLNLSDEDKAWVDNALLKLDGKPPERDK